MNMQFTLFLRAGLTSPDVVGACSECHAVHLLVKMKSLEYQPRLISLDNPPPEFTSVGLQNLPAVVHSDGTGTDQDVIEEIETKYYGGLYKPKPKDLQEAEDATKDIYPKFCEYMYGGNFSALLEKLEALESYFKGRETKFLLADEMCVLDCVMLPRLHELRVAIDRVKGTPIPDTLTKVWVYIFHGYRNKRFTRTCPYDMEICLAWTQKIGAPTSVIKMPEWLPKDHHGTYYSFNVPNICVCPAIPRKNRKEEESK